MGFSFPTSDNIDEGFTFGCKLDTDAYRENRQRYPNVCYKYLQMDGRYGFDQPEWNTRDAVAYFDSMCTLANMPIRDFDYLDKQEWHFNPSKVYKGQNLYAALEPIFGEKLLNTPEKLPPFYHFALYQDEGVMADRSSGCKSPRIYFFIGDNATLYPMFYDPYHEINPMSEE